MEIKRTSFRNAKPNQKQQEVLYSFFFLSETNNCIKIEKHEKDEKSSPRCTNLIKKIWENLPKQGGLYKKTEGLYTYSEPRPYRPNLKECKSTASQLSWITLKW